MRMTPYLYFKGACQDALAFNFTDRFGARWAIIAHSKA